MKWFNPIHQFFFRKKTNLFIAALSAMLFVLCSQSNPNDQGVNEPMKKAYLSELAAFDSTVLNFNSVVQHDSTDRGLLQAEFLKTRIAFKRIAFLLQYIDILRYQRFNGPDLQMVDEHYPGVRIYEPQGLQVLESALWADTLDPAEIRHQLVLLDYETKLFTKYIEKTALKDEMMLTAARYELIEIETKGVTGFDVPICKNTMPELLTQFETLKKYLTFIDPPGGEKYFDKILELMNSGIVSLKKQTLPALPHNGFDTFDRLKFIRSYIQPLTDNLLKFQQETNLVDLYIVSEKALSPVNYFSNNIYNADFINQYAYSRYSMLMRSDKITALGKLLFFDPLLSYNNKLSCASCHQPGKFFTDGLQTAITNVEGVSQERNAPTLLNAAFQHRYFYQLNGFSLEHQADIVMSNPREFNCDQDQIREKLSESKTYVDLFKEAFPDMAQYPINPISVNTAIANFVRTLQAMNSPFDLYMRDTKKTIDSSVYRGFNLFMGKAQCGICHYSPTFYGNVPPFFRESESEVIGAPADTNKISKLDPDEGRYKTKPAEKYKNAFKTSTVRNIEVTAPYMHNGVFKTLEQVVDFYDHGGGAGMGLDVPNQTLSSDSLHLTDIEKKDIVSFMKSLTDKSVKVDEPVLPKIECKPELDKRRGAGY